MPPKDAGDLWVPRPWVVREGALDEAVRADLDDLEQRGVVRPVGRDGSRLFPATHGQAESLLRRFLRYRLPYFGPYQDTMLTGDWAMAHALLSVPMNMGLLDPLAVVRSAEWQYRRGSAPLSSVEILVRQVLG